MKLGIVTIAAGPQHRWSCSWPWFNPSDSSPSQQQSVDTNEKRPAAMSTRPAKQRVDLLKLLDRSQAFPPEVSDGDSAGSPHSKPSLICIVFVGVLVTVDLIVLLDHLVAAVQANEQVWLPSPPHVEKPRAVHNAASLAYLGDAIYEVYVRRHFLTPPQSIDKYNKLVMGVVCCEAQDAMVRRLLKDSFLTIDERDVLRWGKNLETGQRHARRRAGAAVYNSASSLETLIGYLYLTNQQRLQELMAKVGFSDDSSSMLVGFGLGQTSGNGKSSG